jgi:hypothetical protein
VTYDHKEKEKRIIEERKRDKGSGCVVAPLPNSYDPADVFNLYETGLFLQVNAR